MSRRRWRRALFPVLGIVALLVAVPPLVHRRSRSAATVGRSADNPDVPPHTKASVTDFGARCDGRSDDTAAFQRALDQAVRVRIPAGTCMVRSGIAITKDGTRLVGGGPTSVVKLLPGNYGAIFSLPHPCLTMGGCEPDPNAVVKDIQLGWFTIDGQRNGNPANDQTKIVWGIQASAVDGLDVAWMQLKDISGDAMSVAIGSRQSVHVTVRNSRIAGAGRNGIHYGSVRDGRILRNLIENTPDQGYPGAGAGNGIDVETEGLVPVVEDFLIEDNLIREGRHATAGAGMQISRSFGPVRRGTVRDNIIENYQEGVVLGSVEGVDVEGNLVTSDSTVNTATGGAFAYSAPPSFSAGLATFRRNIAWLVPYRPFADNAFWASGGGAITVEDNKIYGPDSLYRIAGAPPAITSRNNQYSTSTFAVTAGAGGQPVASNDDERVSAPSAMPAGPAWSSTWVPPA